MVVPGGAGEYARSAHSAGFPGAERASGGASQGGEVDVANGWGDRKTHSYSVYIAPDYIRGRQVIAVPVNDVPTQNL